MAEPGANRREDAYLSAMFWKTPKREPSDALQKVVDEHERVCQAAIEAAREHILDGHADMLAYDLAKPGEHHKAKLAILRVLQKVHRDTKAGTLG